MNSHSAGLIAVSLATSLLSCSASAQQLSAKQIAQETFPSTVLLLMEDFSGQPSVLGSGFFVADNLIATNFHVIRGAAKGYAKLVGQKSRFPIIGVAGFDEKRDLALLSVNAKAPALHLAQEEAMEVGAEALASLPPGFKLVEKISVKGGRELFLRDWSAASGMLTRIRFYRSRPPYRPAAAAAPC